MRPFSYGRPVDLANALDAGRVAGAAYLGGGTTLIDLMKLDVKRPGQLIDIGGLTDEVVIGSGPAGLRIGALARMADVAEHPVVRRDYPAIRQSLLAAASQQLRNMARIGGNLLQSTRCSYYRDVSFAACNRRRPGSGCAAMAGNNRGHAILGTSAQCIATYPGDLAQVLVALGATLEIRSTSGTRWLPVAELHRLPGDAPEIETDLRAGEMIAAVAVPAGAWTRRSLYLKIRDRDSYAFALASAAVALELDAGHVVAARIALGGVATVPWRSTAAEAVLSGKDLDEGLAKKAADAAFAEAVPHSHNRFKIELGKQTLVRALMTAAQMDIA